MNTIRDLEMFSCQQLITEVNCYIFYLSTLCVFIYRLITIYTLITHFLFLDTSKGLFLLNKMSAKSGFSEEAISDAQETFMLFDTKGDGMIPCNQVNNHESSKSL